MADVLAGALGGPYLQEACCVPTKKLQRCALDGTTFEGGRARATCNDDATHFSVQAGWKEPIRIYEGTWGKGCSGITGVEVGVEFGWRPQDSYLLL